MRTHATTQSGDAYGFEIGSIDVVLPQMHAIGPGIDRGLPVIVDEEQRPGARMPLCTTLKDSSKAIGIPVC